MPDSSWWGRAKLPPRSPLLAIRKRKRLYTLHRDAHEITLEKRNVPAFTAWEPLEQAAGPGT
jgi:hypothetical protein